MAIISSNSSTIQFFKSNLSERYYVLHTYYNIICEIARHTTQHNTPFDSKNIINRTHFSYVNSLTQLTYMTYEKIIYFENNLHRERFS